MIITLHRILLALTSLALLLAAILPGQSSAQALGDNPQFQALDNYVNVFLASKKSATAGQKENYHQGLTSRTESARGAVQQRFIDNRQNAWNKNRRAVENYKAAAWPGVESIINEIRAGYQVDRFVLDNTLSEDIRMIEEEWDPVIEELQERLENLSERQAVYNNDLQQVSVQEAAEIQEINNDYAEDWQGYGLELQERFSAETLPKLTARRDGDVQKARQLLDKGLAAIKAMK